MEKDAKADGELTEQELGAITGAGESLTPIGSAEEVKIPQTTEQSPTDTYTRLSNIMKEMHDAMMAPINNLRG